MSDELLIQFLQWIQDKGVIKCKRKDGIWLYPGYPLAWEVTHSRLIEMFKEQNKII